MPSLVLVGAVMSHLVLLGDSIFDNAAYVKQGESVIELLRQALGQHAAATLLAVDGAVTTDVAKQLRSLPRDTSHVFISAGGNDALRSAHVLNQPASSVADALATLSGVREVFRVHYVSMLKSVLAKSGKVTVSTIYNSVPGVDPSALTALALFNEVILQEAAAIGLPIIDLRIICNEAGDYSSISPIEPSGQGAQKIADAILRVWRGHDLSLLICGHAPQTGLKNDP